MTAVRIFCPTYEGTPADVGPQPNYVGQDLDAIVDQLIERYGAHGPDQV
ncbi:hypothetical protein ACH4VM_03330 [Streptomyces sp. NPDC020792]